MNGFIGNIENLVNENTAFRRVIFTGNHMQLVLMTLQVNEEIGKEKHALVDQFFRIEGGAAKIVVDGVESILTDGMVAIVPAGSTHNLINVGSGLLRMYTIYSPANHPVGTIHLTKAEADHAEALG